MWFSRSMLLLCGLVLVSAGCNKLRDTAIKQKISNDLKTLCNIYGDYYIARGFGPAKLQDLRELAHGDPVKEAALNAVESGRYTMIWRVDVHAAGRSKYGMSGTVLGYETKVPTSGGMVTMVDGTVLDMKPATFAKSPKGDALDLVQGGSN